MDKIQAEAFITELRKIRMALETIASNTKPTEIRQMGKDPVMPTVVPLYQISEPYKPPYTVTCKAYNAE